MEPLDRAVVRLSPNLDLIPSTIDLASADMDLVAQLDRERALRNALEPVRRLYDFIIIDCRRTLNPELRLLGILAANEEFGTADALFGYRRAEHSRGACPPCGPGNRGLRDEAIREREAGSRAERGERDDGRER